MVTTNGSTSPVGTHTPEAGRWVSLQEAATELRMSRDSVRRRVAARVLRAERRRTVRGPRLFVWIPADGVPELVEVPEEGAPAEPPARVAARGGADSASGGADAVRGDAERRNDALSGATLAAARAEEMARYTAVLLEPWRRQVEEQAERIGRLEERAEHLEAERDAARVDLEHAQAEQDTARAELEAARRRAEDASREAEAAKREAEAARRETEETVRLAEEAAGLRAAAEAGARRPWWRFW